MRCRQSVGLAQARRTPAGRIDDTSRRIDQRDAHAGRHVPQVERERWSRHWIEEGFRALESLLADNEFDVDSFEVLSLARDSGCSAYDCEFIALARQLGVKLVTEDAKLRAAFPRLTSALPEG